MFLLGYDIGSSSIKAALVEAETGKTVAVTHYPDNEMDIIARQTGWAEQQPEIWWNNLRSATQRLLADHPVDRALIKGIGISYQMHGLVLIDKDQRVLRPAIIWCDSRAIQIGNQAFQEIGNEKCLNHLLNSPGNFTASKLKWVKDHEPEIYDQIYKILLPGDFIAMKMTGEALTSISGLSEAMLWDFKAEKPARFVLDYMGISDELIPEYLPSVSDQGRLTHEAAQFLDLQAGIPIGYRAGDQPNNALSLNVLNSGEVAATGGTSGVVYAVVDKAVYDPKTRVNSFAHINHLPEDPRIGVLLCINGAGIQYSWIKQMLATEQTSYSDMERMVGSVPVNSDGLRLIPFGNGAERVLENKNPGAQFINLQFNRHSKAHFYRAALEGIAFSFIYGIEVMQEMGLNIDVMKVGNDNLFQSEVFSTTISSILDCEIHMMNTTGAVGAAKASGVTSGIYKNLGEAFTSEKPEKIYGSVGNRGDYMNGYHTWKSDLQKLIQ